MPDTPAPQAGLCPALLLGHWLPAKGRDASCSPCKHRRGGIWGGGKITANMHVVHAATDAPWTRTCKYERGFSSRAVEMCNAQTHYATYVLFNSGSQTPHRNVENNFHVSLHDLKSLMLLKSPDECPWQGCGRAWDTGQGVKPLVHEEVVSSRVWGVSTPMGWRAQVRKGCKETQWRREKQERNKQ